MRVSNSRPGEWAEACAKTALASAPAGAAARNDAAASAQYSGCPTAATSNNAVNAL